MESGVGYNRLKISHWLFSAAALPGSAMGLLPFSVFPLVSSV